MASFSTVTQEKTTLEGLLWRTRWRCWTLGIIRALTWLGVGICGLFLLLSLWMSLAPPRFGLQGIWIVAGLLALVAASVAGWRHARALQEEALSKALGRWAPETKGLLSAIELARALEEPQATKHFSPALAEARIRQVYAQINGLRAADLVPLGTLPRQAYLLFGLSSLIFGLFLLRLETASWLVRGMFFPEDRAGSAVSMDMRGELLLGDLEVQYHYPAYTGLPPRVIPNSDGTLAALKGTAVRLRGRALYPTRKAQLLIGQDQRVTMKIEADQRTLSAEITLAKDAIYRIEHIDDAGRLRFSTAHAIRVEQDAYPRIKLLDPTEEITVQEREKLNLSYEASDDYGLSQLSVIYKNLSSKRLNQEMSQTLRAWKDNQREDKAEIAWDLATMPFSPGDRISYQLEILDNDTISGPKRTRTPPLIFRIASPTESNERLIAQQEKLLAEMTIFLADLLERPEAEKAPIPALKEQLSKLDASGDKLLRHFALVQAAMRKDALTRPLTLISLETMRLRFAQRHEDRGAFSQRLRESLMEDDALRTGYEDTLRAEVEPQEDDVYALSMLIQRQHLDIIDHLRKQLGDSQQRLRELLDQYRKDKDPQTKAALMQEMRRMERLIEKIRERMSKLQRDMPDEYLNLDAMKPKDALEKLKKMQENLKQDNLEKAAEELSELAQEIEKMSSQLDKLSDEAGGSSSQLPEAMKKLMQELDQLEKKQSRLAQRTQQMRKEIAKKMQAALEKKLEQLVQQQQKRIAQIQKNLQEAEEKTKDFNQMYRFDRNYEAMKQDLAHLEKLLKSRDIFESRQSVRRFQQEAQRLESSFEMQQRYAEMMKDSLKRLQKQWEQGASTPYQQQLKSRYERMQKQRGSLEKATQKLQRAHEIAEQIRRDLDQLTPSEKPYLSQKQRQQLQQNQQDQQGLEQETQQLQQKMAEMGKKLPIFSPQMQRMMQDASNHMRDAGEQLGKKEPRPAHDAQEQAASKLRKMKQQMQQMMQQQGGKGDGAGRNKREKVEIPDASKHKAPKALRQDILDAMKEKLPKPYREPANRYYEKLVK